MSSAGAIPVAAVAAVSRYDFLLHVGLMLSDAGRVGTQGWVLEALDDWRALATRHRSELG